MRPRILGAAPEMASPVRAATRHVAPGGEGWPQETAADRWARHGLPYRRSSPTANCLTPCVGAYSNSKMMPQHSTDDDLELHALERMPGPRHRAGRGASGAARSVPGAGRGLGRVRVLAVHFWRPKRRSPLPRFRSLHLHTASVWLGYCVRPRRMTRTLQTKKEKPVRKYSTYPPI